jgi:hypothetical protein
MEKQKARIVLSATLTLFISMFFGSHAFAKGGATVTWTAPTTNEDGSALTDLVGYRVFYSTSALDCDSWDAATSQSARLATSLASIAHVDVSESSTLRDVNDAGKRGYTFNTENFLIPGLTYNFTVVAYNQSNGYSKCVNDAGANKVKNKLIYHTGNLKNYGTVNISDLSILAGDFGKTLWCRIAGHSSDINGDCGVNITDLSILAGEWGL